MIKELFANIAQNSSSGSAEASKASGLETIHAASLFSDLMHQISITENAPNSKVALEDIGGVVGEQLNNQIESTEDIESEVNKVAITRVSTNGIQDQENGSKDGAASNAINKERIAKLDLNGSESSSTALDDSVKTRISGIEQSRNESVTQENKELKLTRSTHIQQLVDGGILENQKTTLSKDSIVQSTRQLPGQEINFVRSDNQKTTNVNASAIVRESEVDALKTSQNQDLESASIYKTENFADQIVKREDILNDALHSKNNMVGQNQISERALATAHIESNKAPTVVSNSEKEILKNSLGNNGRSDSGHLVDQKVSNSLHNMARSGDQYANQEGQKINLNWEKESFSQRDIQRQIFSQPANRDQFQPEIIQNFEATKKPELLQMIQSNKSGLIKPKDAKEARFALTMTEHAETRLKLLVDSVRPEILPTREVPVGFISTHTLDESIHFNHPTLTLNSDQEALLKEFMMESVQGKDQKVVESNFLGYMRLGELPVLNASARKALVHTFTSVLQQEATSARAQEEQWQKHSFKLDDGHNIDMTTKNVDGVLHIKLAASNPELNRLLQNMEQELKEHLKEELDLELDLEFANGSEESSSNFEDEHDTSQSREIRNSMASISEEATQTSAKGLQSSIRHFGYNQMEWTV